MAFVIINNQLIDAKNAQVSIHDRGFRYGDGVFETIAVHDGVPYQFDWHMERLRKGLHAVKIDGNLHTLHEQCRRLIRENGAKDAILRIQITRGSGGKGYLPDAVPAPTLVIETLPLHAPPAGPVSLWLSDWQKITPRSLPVQYKLCQGMSSTLARMEAAENDCFEALLLNHQGQVCETSAGNIFWLKGDTLYTPALTCGVLEGAMRAAVMRLSPYAVREPAETLEALEGAQAVFITNSVWKVRAVGRLRPKGTAWKPSPALDALKTLVENDLAAHGELNRARW